MFLKDLTGSAKRSTERLGDLTDAEVVGYLQDSLDALTLRLGINFTVAGNTWDTYDVTLPDIDRGLARIIVLQAKQIANSSSNVERTKVGDLTVQYDNKAWERDEQTLEDLIESYAEEHGISIPSGYVAFSSNEYDLLLNPDINLDTLIRARDSRFRF